VAGEPPHRGASIRIVLVSTVLAAIVSLAGGAAKGQSPDALPIDPNFPTQSTSAQVEVRSSDAVIMATAVSPYWPADGTIIAVRTGPTDHRSDIVRTRDGGHTWERLPGPEQDDFAPRFTGIPYFGFVPTDGQARTLLLMSPGVGAATVLYRSDDLGNRWTNVLELRSPGPLLLSPSFTVDQVALVVSDGTLYRSNDGGASWRMVPAADQPVLSAAFSPDFRVDRTIFVSTRFNAQRQDAATNAILISTDGGETWMPSAGGLEAEPNRYGMVGAVTVSPTFALDATVYAIATIFAPECRPQSRPQSPCRRDSHVVRSRDRGQSWEPVLQLGDVSEQSVRFGQGVALSEAYARDGFALVNAPRLGLSGVINGCSLFRTHDGGNTWEGGIVSSGTTAGTPGLGARCERLELYGGEDGLAFVDVGYTAGTLYSIGGESWSRFSRESLPFEITDHQRIPIDPTLVPSVPQTGANRRFRQQVQKFQRRMLTLTPTTLTLVGGSVNVINIVTYRRDP
jgi:hypothetical protein